MRQTFIIQPDPHPSRMNALEAVRMAQVGMVVEIKPRTRSLDQNALLHKLLGEISKTQLFAGKKRTIDQWKLIMVSGHAVVTGLQSDIVPGIEGEFINLRESTASMSVRRLSSLVEYISSWCVENEVNVNDLQ